MRVQVLRQRAGTYFGLVGSGGRSSRARVLLVTLPLAVLAAVLAGLLRAGHLGLAVLAFALGWPLVAVGSRLARRCESRRSAASRAEDGAEIATPHQNR